MSEAENVEVTQADRDAAIRWHGYEDRILIEVEEFEVDELAQAFARHRLSSRPTQGSELRVAIEGLLKLEGSITTDVGTAHNLRGQGASSEMRSDDRDMRAEMRHAFAALHAALAATPSDQSLREALEPFARLARPINGEAGRRTYLEAISGPNGTDELQLSTYVGDGHWIEILDAADFRRAAEVLDAALSSTNPPVPDGEGWQPIETAPKDRAIDLWVVETPDYNAHRVADAIWESVVENWRPAGSGQFHFGQYRCPKVPTHWRERPPPPAALAEGLTEAQRQEAMTGRGHVTRFSDASRYDEICILCGRTDDPIRWFGKDHLETEDCGPGLAVRAILSQQREG